MRWAIFQKSHTENLFLLSEDQLPLLHINGKRHSKEDVHKGVRLKLKE